MNDEEMIYCSRCGEAMKASSRYCMKCGNLNYDHPENREVLKIAKATRRLDQFFDQVEAYLGDAALPPPEPLDGEEEALL